MNEQTTQAEPSAATLMTAVGEWIDKEFVRRFREEFDGAEARKRENNRRLQARLTELRAQRGAV